MGGLSIHSLSIIIPSIHSYMYLFYLLFIQSFVYPFIIHLFICPLINILFVTSSFIYSPIRQSIHYYANCPNLNMVSKYYCVCANHTCTSNPYLNMLIIFYRLMGQWQWRIHSSIHSFIHPCIHLSIHSSIIHPPSIHPSIHPFTIFTVEVW